MAEIERQEKEEAKRLKDQALQEEARAKGYGKLYAAMGGGEAGLEACVAVEALCEVGAGCGWMHLYCSRAKPSSPRLHASSAWCVLSFERLQHNAPPPQRCHRDPVCCVCLFCCVSIPCVYTMCGYLHCCVRHSCFLPALQQCRS